MKYFAHHIFLGWGFASFLISLIVVFILRFFLDSNNISYSIQWVFIFFVMFFGILLFIFYYKSRSVKYIELREQGIFLCYYRSSGKLDYNINAADIINIEYDKIAAKAFDSYYLVNTRDGKTIMIPPRVISPADFGKFCIEKSIKFDKRPAPVN